MYSKGKISALLGRLLALFVAQILSASFAVAEDIQDRVFRIEVREVGAPATEKSASAFLVHKDGYLITSLNAVIPVVLNPGKFELLVFTESNPTIGQIEAINLPGDIALLRVPKSFSSAFAIEEQRVEVGAELYWAGYPMNQNFFSGPVVFLDWKQSTSFGRMAYSSELRQGMEGGPILNSSGKVVSVILSDSNRRGETFGAPVGELTKLIQKIGKAREPASLGNWKKEFSYQVKAAEKNYIPVDSADSSNKRRKFGSISFLPIGLHPKCKNEEVSSRGRSGHVVHCKEQSKLEIDETISLMNSSFFVINQYRLATEVLDFPKMDSFLKDKEGRSISSLRSSFCTIRNLKNSKNVRMIVRICSKDDPVFEGLSSTYLKVNLQDDPLSDYLIQSYFSGLTFDFTIDRIADFLESISLEKK